MKPKPSYNLDQAKELVAGGSYRMTKKVTDWLVNHGFHSGDAVEGVFESLTPEGFYKTDPLKNRPGVFADIYFAEYDGERWYVKFFIDDDDSLAVDVWSCRLDGFIA